jgi:hypothetical protein
MPQSYWSDVRKHEVAIYERADKHRVLVPRAQHKWEGTSDIGTPTSTKYEVEHTRHLLKGRMDRLRLRTGYQDNDTHHYKAFTVLLFNEGGRMAVAHATLFPTGNSMKSLAGSLVDFYVAPAVLEVYNVQKESTAPNEADYAQALLELARGATGNYDLPQQGLHE